MSSIVQRLTEGVVNRDMRAESHALLTKWKKTGLLEGLEDERVLVLGLGPMVLPVGERARDEVHPTVAALTAETCAACGQFEGLAPSLLTLLSITQPTDGAAYLRSFPRRWQT